MKNTFKPITFDRKQRVAFLIILLAIFAGGVWNIWGVSYDQDPHIDAVDLETAIVEQRNYKRYWRKIRHANSWGSYKHKQNTYSYHKSNASDSSKLYQAKERNYIYQSDEEKSMLVNTKSIFEKVIPLDSISTIEVPDDYTEEKQTIDTSQTSDRLVKYELHNFDPNTVSKEELLSMFLPDKWASNLINYRNKGGTFQSKGSVKKLYSTTDELYRQIEPYIMIDEEKLADAKAQAYEQPNQEWLEELKREGRKIDLSDANAETLRKLPNISMGVAGGIVKYRELLGGYHHIDQLSEVYYMTPEGLEALKTYCVLEPVIDYININTASIDQLGKHPYITYKRANVIKKYIQNHGEFAEVADVIKVGVWDQVQFEKLRPYLITGKE